MAGEGVTYDVVTDSEGSFRTIGGNIFSSLFTGIDVFFIIFNFVTPDYERATIWRTSPLYSSLVLSQEPPGALGRD